MIINEGTVLTNLVPRSTVKQWIIRLNGYIKTANAVTVQSTLMDIGQAEIRLHRARELFTVLWEMKALDNWEEVEEQLNRIDSKILDIRTEKRRNAMPGWRRS